MLRARLFGPLEVEINGCPVPGLAGLRPRAVLAWLLLHPGRHSRSGVAARFWPEVLDTSARASLRTVLWTVRTALDEVSGADYLETGRDSVGVSGALPRHVDTEEFERLATQSDPDALRRCYELAKAPLLTDLADDWVLDARDAFRERTADVALRLARWSAEQGAPRETAMWARRTLERVPFRESAHRLLMQGLADAGETAEALAAYQRCREVLSAEFGTTPSERTQALAARLRARGRRGDRTASPGTSARKDGSSLNATTATPVVDTLGGVPLIGRDGELKEALAVWDRTRQGRGGVLVVNGAAGLGKSRLVEELSAQAVRQGARHGRGTAFELAGAPAFAPWSEVLRELVAEVPVPPSASAWPSDLARLCRSVEWRWGRTAAAPIPDPEQERSCLFEAVAETLAWCARDRPLLLVLEDVQLADRASVALLAYVGGQLTRLPALLVVTRRPSTSRQDLALALDALARRDALQGDITLTPLLRTHVEQLVSVTSPTLAPDVRSLVVAAAEGNPMLARQAARAAAAGQDLSQGLRTWLRAPLARLPAPARLLVDSAAAAGRPLELGEAAELVGAEPLTSAVVAASAEDLVEVRDRRVQFVHALVRDACYGDLEPVRRASLHSRLADVLEGRVGRSPSEVARHLLLAGRPTEARGHLLTAASHARSLGAVDETVELLQAAAAVGPEPPEVAAEVWLSLAEAEAWRGSREGHDTAFTQAVSLLERIRQPTALAAAYLLRGQCLRTTLCYPREAVRAYHRALDVVDNAGVEAPELRVLALAGEAWVEASIGDPERGAALVGGAEARPEAAADPGLTAELQLSRGAALLRTRRFAEAEQVSEQAAELAVRAGRSGAVEIGLLQAASAAAARRALTRVMNLTARVLRSRCGTGLRADTLALRAYALSRAGRHDAARAAVEEELALLERIGHPPQLSTAAYDAGSLALAAGRYDDAVVRLSEALVSSGDRVPRALARLRLAEARVRGGDPAAAEKELERFPYEPVGPADLPEALVPHLERVEALVAAAQGRHELAHDRLASAEAGWRRLLAEASHGDPYAASIIGLGRGYHLECIIEPGVELGRTLAERAELWAREGEWGHARRTADEADDLARRYGYQGYEEVLVRVRELMDGGRRPR